MSEQEELVIGIIPSEGSVRNRTRRGRGNASGLGGEAGRGHKGQKSRSGYSKRAGFEGGQMPLYRRLPKKRGQHNRFRVEYVPINLSLLEERFNEGDTVDLAALYNKGLIKKSDRVKILGNGELKKKLTIKAHKASQSAIEKINAANSTFEPIQ